MAMGSARLRVVLVLLLGSTVGIAPMRPVRMLLGGSGIVGANRSLKHSPVRPQRLRIFHSGQTLPVVLRRSMLGREVHGSRHRPPARTLRFSLVNRRLLSPGSAIACH